MMIFLLLTGKEETSLVLNAVQYILKGQFSQIGVGLQTTAPKSMMAWLYRPGFCLSSSSLASLLKTIFPAAESIAVLMLKILDITLKTFPSITACGSLKAKDAIAEAVYVPMPFNLLSSSYRRGNFPFNLRETCLAVSIML